jgi:hypothetical protein
MRSAGAWYLVCSAAGSAKAAPISNSFVLANRRERTPFAWVMPPPLPLHENPFAGDIFVVRAKARRPGLLDRNRSDPSFQEVMQHSMLQPSAPL